MADGSMLVILDRSRVEDFWSEQAGLLEKRSLSTFSDCLVLQTALLENFFGVTLRVNENIETSEVRNVDLKEDEEAVKLSEKMEKVKAPKKSRKPKKVKREPEVKEEIKESIDFCSVDETGINFEEQAEEAELLSTGRDDHVEVANHWQGEEKMDLVPSWSRQDEDLKLEVKSEPLQPRFSCTFCGTDQQSYKRLKKHVDDDHLGLSYHCSLCIFTSQDKDASMEHMEVEHDQMKNLDLLKFECGICRFRGEIQEHSDHILIDHPEFSDFLFDAIDDEVQVIEEPNVKFPGEMKVERDQDQRWPCTICGFRAADKHTLRVHVEMNHLNIRYECTVCGLNTKEMYIVRNHTVKEHGDERNDTKLLDYCCGLCNFRGLKKDFLDHIFTDHAEFGVFFATHGKHERSQGKKTGLCNFCQLTFACNLSSHIETVHMRAIYTCADSNCEQRSKVKRSILEHLEMEHLPAQFRAGEGKVGLDGRYWIRKNLQYLCSQCDLTIKSHPDLVLHMTKEHQDAIIIQKELPCNKCALVFHTKASRAEHMEVHKTDEDPTATCQTCGHVGSTESNLRVHIMMRHMKARFTCLSCRKQFKFPSECRSHIKKFHSKENTGMECVCQKCGIDPTHFEEFISHAESEHKMPSKGRRGQRVAKAPLVTQLQTSEPDRFCRYCDFSSQSKGAAKVHMDLFHTRTSYSCQVCGFGSKRKLDVVKHIRNDHNGTVSSESVSNLIFYHCAVCQLAEVKERFLAHLSDHTEGETSLGKEEVEEAASYSCTRCLNFKNDKSSTISHIISEHMEEHSEESGVSMQEFVTGLLLINCRYCTFTGSLVDFYSHSSGCLASMAPLEGAQAHRSFNLPENESACTFCGAEVANREGVKNHVLFKHIKAVQSCSPCQLKLKNKSTAMKHMAEQHPEATPSSCISVECGLCPFQSTEGDFSSHMDNAHIEQMEVEELIEMLSCKQCDFAAVSKAKLAQHKKTAHVKLVCLRCETNEEFPDKKKLNQHNIQVHQERINCTDCSFSTKHKTALQRHKESVHEGKRKFGCSMEDCDKDFTRKEYLLLHHKKDHILAA